MATTNGVDFSATSTEEAGKSTEQVNAAPTPIAVANSEEIAKNARVDAMWEKMNKGLSNKSLNDMLKKSSTTTVKKTSKKSSTNWMTYLGLAPKGAVSPKQDVPKKEPSIAQDSSSDEAKMLAAAALAAVRDIAASASGRGKVEIMEVRDFAGQEIEVKKLVDADSKEALEKTKVTAPSAVDAVLEQIKKKQKLSVLDKTKKDWGEYKEENKGLEEELDAYKKSSNQYLDKVSFLQRTDYREFERERDARLAVQAKRRPDMREEP
ncbi:SWR1-complex protein 5/Craniofacial development protein [Trema orientale]|uniref:SWR1-complex protein 5/Craniofacial development protein n=1 Tax=Trema orientale TaxID=63057 RepID=A0A2P5F5Q3_TREOI|nr:SWR1-complex protein 5/Craniofacial development protein [Trema orientale]